MLNCIVCSSSVLPAKTLRSAGISREIWAENFPGQRKLFSQSEKNFFLGREGKLSSQRVFSPNPPCLRFLPFVSIFVHIHVFPVLIVLGFHCSFCLSVFPPFSPSAFHSFHLLQFSAFRLSPTQYLYRWHVPCFRVEESGSDCLPTRCGSHGVG